MLRQTNMTIVATDFTFLHNCKLTTSLPMALSSKKKI